MNDSADNTSASDIAIVGMACRFPGANSPDEFWTLLKEGRESLAQLDDAALREAGVSESLLADPLYVKAGMYLQGMEQFDPGFFGFSPRDGKILDPQHRHFLECCWEALEDGGYDPARYDGAIGVFAGSGHNAYLPYNLLSNPGLVSDVGFFLLRHTGNDKDFMATRVSYCLDLKGPSVNVQTACSTSLVAIHQAAQSLLNGECDMVLAGGVTIELPHRQGYLYKESEILSKDGHCRPFDADSSGTVFGSGVGVVLLKRLDDALADGDQIHAVIKSSAVNNDGAGKVSYLAPSVDGQAAAIQEALAIADIDPASVSYIECHGTGTQLGDPIEAAALAQAYAVEGRARNSCGVGSVKSNIGHLDTAAGVASLIKVVQALKHRQLPATLHFRNANPAINFANSPFYVNASLRDWNTAGPLRAGISSLGVGGTNAHLIVEEPPQAEPTCAGRSRQLLLLSARSDTALRGGRERLGAFLRESGADIRLADVAYTLATGRRGFRRRGVLVAENAAEAANVLAGENQSGFSVLDAPDSARDVVFMFAGGGAQYPNMGRDLYQQEPVYRAAVDECLAIAGRLLDFDLKALLYPAPGQESQAAKELERPSRTLPALFVTQYAQARLWQAWGIEPVALIGHSMGENTAACIAGVFALQDALGLVALRGRLFESLPAGGMLGVQLSAAELEPLMDSSLCLAAINGPELSVVSGPVASLQAFEQRLAAREVSCQRIRIDVAAHSSMLEPILREFESYLRGLKLNAPKLPFVSNLTGDWITADQARDPAYWVRHLRQTVRFGDGVARLLAEDRYALLEVGPGRTLTSLARLQTAAPGRTITNSLRHPDEQVNDLRYMLLALGRLWQGGVEPDWARFYEMQVRGRISLPTYAFDHQTLWVEPGRNTGHTVGERLPMDDWFYQPAWTQRPLPQAVAATTGVCLIGPAALTARLAPAFRQRGVRVVEVTPAAQFARSASDQFQVTEDEAGYRQLGEALGSDPLQCHFVVADDVVALSAPLNSLFAVARAVANGDIAFSAFTLVTTRAQHLPGETATSSPAAGALVAALRVVATETRLPVMAIDLPAGWGEREAGWLSRETPDTNAVLPVAYRGGRRWLQELQPCPLPAPQQSGQKDNAVYLITGGFGGLGLTLAQHLAKRPVKLALLGRHLPPTGEEADFYLAAGGDTARRILALRALINSGADILQLQADVADAASVQAAVQQVEQRWGRINGVFHTAGVLADALLPLKTDAEMAQVLGPKVQGLQNLQAALRDHPLDCFILYSSTSVLAGLPGQFDYAAANAYLDACVQAQADDNQPLLAVNWPVWREVGMAAALLARPANALAQTSTDVRTLVRGDRYYRVVKDSDWLVDQHCTREGIALVPGTGFVELAWCAATACLPGSGSVSVADMFLLQPLIVADGASVVVAVVFEAGGQFGIYSSVDADHAQRGEWLAQHAQGTAARQEAPAPTLDVTALQARIPARQRPANGLVDHAQMAFGARWACVRQIGYAGAEALINLALAPQFSGDFTASPLHPALLDMATGAAQELLPERDLQHSFFVPQSYGEIRVYAPLTSNLVSHITRQAGTDADSCTTDILIADTDGRVLMEVRGFVMRRLAGATFESSGATAQPDDDAMQALFADGIDPQEGMAVIDRLLGNPGINQVVVLPKGPEQLARRANADAMPEDNGALSGEDRPALSTEYVAPESDLERQLAELWQKAIGVGRIGVRDDFFELGGHSLLLIQLVNRSKKLLGVSLPLSQLFGKPTIADWAQLAGAGAAVDAAPATAKPVLKRVSRDAYRAGTPDQ